jgi:hypothetical protein
VQAKPATPAQRELTAKGRQQTGKEFVSAGDAPALFKANPQFPCIRPRKKRTSQVIRAKLN